MAMCNGKLLSGSFEDAITPLGVIRAWDLSTGSQIACLPTRRPFLRFEPVSSLAGLSKPFTGPDGTQKGGHASLVMKIRVRSNGDVVTIGRDDSMLISGSDGIYKTKTPLEAAPVDMACGDNLVAIVTNTKELKLSSGSAIDTVVPISMAPTCVAVSPDDSCVAIGGEDNAVHIFDSKGVTKMPKLERHRDAISCVAYSCDSALLASGCANKDLVIWSAKDGSPLVTGLNGFHTTRLSCLAWSPGGKLASGGVDSAIMLWTPETLKEKKPLSGTKLAHTGGGINALVFVNEDTVASAGADACIKFWKV
ncbi:MAG: hypothetical protein SGPRY_001849 [Prymnesium sp.]